MDLKSLYQNYEDFGGKNKLKEFVWILSMSIEITETDLNQAFEDLKAGEFSAITVVVGASIEEKPELLEKAAEIISSSIDPTNWSKYEKEFEALVLAGFDNNKIFKQFDKIFARKDMAAFSQYIADLVARYLSVHSTRVIDLELYISSHAAQNSPAFYDYVIQALYAQLQIDMHTDKFSEIEAAFVRFVDFEPQVTLFKVNELMKQSFIEMTNVLRDESGEKMGNSAFFNRIHLWSNFAFRSESFTQAYVTIIVHALRAKSLKLNPLRIKLIQILVNHNEFLAPLTSCAKVLLKSRSHKTGEAVEFEFDNLYLSTKEIGRTQKYQDEVYNRSFDLLKKCLFGLRNRIAFPEIAAPIVRSLEMMIADDTYKQNVKQLTKFKDAIKENATWIECAREKAVQKDGFNIIENTEIEGTAPFKIK